MLKNKRTERQKSVHAASQVSRSRAECVHYVLPSTFALSSNGRHVGHQISSCKVTCCAPQPHFSASTPSRATVHVTFPYHCPRRFSPLLKLSSPFSLLELKCLQSCARPTSSLLSSARRAPCASTSAQNIIRHNSAARKRPTNRQDARRKSSVLASGRRDAELIATLLCPTSHHADTLLFRSNAPLRS